MSEAERVTLLVRDKAGARDRLPSSNPPRMAGRERWALHARALPAGVQLLAILGEARS